MRIALALIAILVFAVLEERSGAELHDDTDASRSVRDEATGAAISEDHPEDPTVFERSGSAIADRVPPLARDHQIKRGTHDAIRIELISLLGEGRWKELRDLTSTLEFHRPYPDRLLADWARRRAGEELGINDEPQPPGSRSVSWQAPYADELNRDTYNTLVELKTLTQSGSFRDAARAIGVARLDRLRGVAPSFLDKDLLWSASVAVRDTLGRFPKLAVCREREFGRLAHLRIQQGVDSGDVPAVRAAVEQFVGTRTAASGQLWLGDQALARGQAGEALTRYRRVLVNANEEDQRLAGARICLAAAMMGLRATAGQATRSVWGT